MAGMLLDIVNGTQATAFRFAFAVLAALLLAGCGNDAPKVDENLVSAFVEIRMAEQTYGADSPAGRLARKGVLERHGYTRESFEAACDKVLDDDALCTLYRIRVVPPLDFANRLPPRE